MPRTSRIYSVFLLAAFLLHPSFARSETPVTADGSHKETVPLTINLTLDAELYSGTIYGSPPQFAIWAVNVETKEIRTIAVTEKTGKCNWQGKTECPVSLPYWVGYYNKETKTQGDPTLKKPVPDAISQPTPKTEFSITTQFPAGSSWDCYIEVNVSGDYNEHFPQSLEKEQGNPTGNAQPSIVYRARIEMKDGATARPKLIGRTEQIDPVRKLNKDLKVITTARKIFSKIEIACRPAKDE